MREARFFRGLESKLRGQVDIMVRACDEYVVVWLTICLCGRPSRRSTMMMCLICALLLGICESSESLTLNEKTKCILSLDENLHACTYLHLQIYIN